MKSLIWPEGDTWLANAVLRLCLLANNNGSEYGEFSVKYALYRILEISAGRRLGADNDKYVVDEIFSILALPDHPRYRWLREKLLSRHHVIPGGGENDAYVREAFSALTLPPFIEPYSFDPERFPIDVFAYCTANNFLFRPDPPS
ncbi:MAG: hypothetical protein KGL39_21440 [Patescibacteria group bacterium]|nr:hypothetical protein [Patescibacteria group bacterium]